jgi:hypothetical protein
VPLFSWVRHSPESAGPFSVKAKQLSHFGRFAKQATPKKGVFLVWQLSFSLASYLLFWGLQDKFIDLLADRE